MDLPPPPYLHPLRRLLSNERAWALFEHGTVVVVPDGEGGSDVADRARLALRHDAAQRAGSAAGDPAVERFADTGWIVSSSDPNVFTFVPDETLSEGVTDVVVGTVGRAAHEADASGGRVVHIESAL